MKSFIELRDEAQNPFHKLLYEMLSRYDDNSPSAAIANTSSPLDQILHDCLAEVNQKLPIAFKPGQHVKISKRFTFEEIAYTEQGTPLMKFTDEEDNEFVLPLDLCDIFHV